MAGAKKTVWDLSLEIAGKDTGAEKALKNVSRSIQDVQKAGKQLSSDFKNFTANAGKLALGVVGGVTAAGAGILKMANSFADVGGQLEDTAAAIGIGIEAYQELQYAMQVGGVSAQEFDKGLQKFNLTVRQGAAGNAAAKKQLEDIGLSAEKLAGMKPEQAMERLSDYMNTLPSDAERTRVAVTLFGKAAGPKMMAAMKTGSAGLRNLMSEARELGAVMTEEQAVQAGLYGDAMDRLKLSVTGMRNQFIGGAIGPLTEAFDHLKNAIADQMPSIQELGAKFGQWLGRAVQELPTIIASIKEFAANVRDTAIKVKDFFGGWENVAKVVGALAIAPTFISGIKTVVSLFGFLKAAVGLASGVMGLFGTSAGAAGAAAAAGGAAGATGFGALAAAVWAATWPVLAVVAAIAAVVLAIKNWDKIVEFAKKVWGAVCGAVKAAVDFIKNVFGKIGEFFSGIWNGIKETAGKVWGGIKDVAGKAWEGIKGAASKAWEGIKAAAQYHPVVFAFNKIKEHGPAAFEKVKEAAGAAWEGIKRGASTAWEGIKGATSKAWEGIKGAASAAGGFLKNNWKSIAVGMVSPMAGGLHALYKNHEGFRNLVNGVWGNIKDTAGNAWGAIKEAGGQAFSFIDNFSGGALTRIKDNVLNVVNNIKSFFTGLWSAIKEGPTATIEFLKNTFLGLFESIKQRIESFVNFFKEKMEAVKNFFGGIGEKAGNFFGGIGDKFKSILPGHAEGGIFTHRHIAEIAESGAEAVVPLNSSPHGFDIWKQAGEIGGYLNRAIGQQTATGPAPAQGTPPVMQAAAQRVSGGENVINVTFTQNNTFSGGAPDGGVVNQIAAAGQQAADDFEIRVKEVLENLMRNQRRVSYA